MFRLFFIGLLWFSHVVHGASIHRLRTLVIYDPRVTKDLDEYSKLFNSLLEKRGYELNYASVMDGTFDGSKSNNGNIISLYENESRLYDNLIIFPIKGRVINNSQINANTLLQFSKDGGDILTITNSDSLNDVVRVYLNQLGIFPSPRGYQVKDYFNNKQDKEDSSLLSVLLNDIENAYVFNNSIAGTDGSTIRYKGSTALLGNGELLVPILRAPRTSFNINNEGDEWSVGTQGHLIAGFQGLNNARTVWLGSSDFFDNNNFEYNVKLSTELIKWVFREKSVIKSVGFSVTHSNGLSFEQQPFKVGDEVHYDVGFSEWNGHEWAPFNAEDIQFELRMIDPYFRLTLEPSKENNDNTSQHYSSTFSLPNHHGVYTFLTDYKRTGLSFVAERAVKPIRHLRYDEYLRSYRITNAWVYLTSLYSVVGLFVVFLACYIQLEISRSKSSQEVSAEKKKN